MTENNPQPLNTPIMRSGQSLYSAKVFVGIFIIMKIPKIKISEDSKILDLAEYL